MATLEQIGNALRKADAAGNVEDARRLAAAYREMRDGGGAAGGEIMITVGGRKIPGSEYRAMSPDQRLAIRNQIADANPEVDPKSSLLDPALQGLTFGWADEARAALNGGVAALTGGDFGGVYNEELDVARQSLAHERRVNPVGSAVAEVAGAIPTGMVAGGQLAGQGAKLATRALTSGVVGAGQGAVYGAGAADDDKGLGGLVGGGVGLGIGAALPVIGNAIAKGVQRSQQGRILDAAAKAAPTADEIRSAASTMFEQATGGTPIAISDNAYMRFLGDVQAVAKKLRINENLDPKSVGLSEMMLSIADDINAGGTVLDLKDLHLLRQAAQRVAMSSEGRDAAFANTIISKLDDFAKGLKPADILGGQDPTAATNALFKGISAWSRASKVGLMEEAIRVGQAAAAGPEKGIRNALRTMIFKKPDIWRRFSAAEQQAIKDVIDGTPASNLMKLIGTFGFGGNTATNGIGGAAGMALGQMAGGPVGMVVGPVLGSIGRNASERMTEGLAQRALGAAATENLRVLPPMIGASPIERLLQQVGNPAQATAVNR